MVLANLHKLAEGLLKAGLALAPADLAQRIEALPGFPPATAFAQLHALEGEVLAIVSAHAPRIDLAPVHNRRTHFVPAPWPRPNPMIEKLFALVVLGVCVVMLVRMFLPPRQQQCLDRMAQRTWWWGRDGALRLWRWPRSVRARRDADRAAQDAIDRASRKRNLH